MVGQVETRPAKNLNRQTGFIIGRTCDKSWLLPAFYFQYTIYIKKTPGLLPGVVFKGLTYFFLTPDYISKTVSWCYFSEQCL